jgi:hypothetical protein
MKNLKRSKTLFGVEKEKPPKGGFFCEKNWADVFG